MRKYAFIKHKLEQAQDMLRRLQEHTDTTAQHTLAEGVKELQACLSPQQPHAAAARCMLMALRDSSPGSA